MRWPVLRCPFCQSVIPNDLRPRDPVATCPSCSRQLQYARWYLYLSGLIALGISLALSLFLGFKGFWLFVVAVLLWLPVSLLWDFAFVRLSTAPFEEYVPPKPSPKIIPRRIARRSRLTLVDLSGRQKEDDQLKSDGPK